MENKSGKLYLDFDAIITDMGPTVIRYFIKPSRNRVRFGTIRTPYQGVYAHSTSPRMYRDSFKCNWWGRV